MLVYVIDVSAPDPIKDYQILLNELEMYKTGLTKKPSLIIANKAEIEGAEAKFELLKEFAACDVVPVSAMLGKNVKAATDLMRGIVMEQRLRLTTVL